MKWFGLLSVMFLILATLLFASPVVYADESSDEEPEMKVDIGIDGELKVDISVKGPSELNVGIKGPSQVHINADDEVTVNVEADDETQVYINDQVNDLPAGDRDQGLPDLDDLKEEAAVEDSQVQLALGEVDDVKTSNTNLKIIAGTVPALALAGLYFGRKNKK